MGGAAISIAVAAFFLSSLGRPGQGVAPPVHESVGSPVPEVPRLAEPGGGVVSGTVVGERGDGVPDTLVLVLRNARGTPLFDVADRVAVDRAGRFRSKELSPAVYDVFATAPGFQPARVEVDLSAPVEPLLIRLEPAAAGISGRVRDINGGPVAGVLVSRELSGFPGEEGALPLTISEADGRYQAPLPPGRHAIRFDSPGYASRVIEANMGQSGADVFLTPGGQIEGILVERGTERPVARATVSARLERTATTRAFAVTGSEGKFSLSPLAPGRYELVARSEGTVASLGQSVELPPLGRVEVKMFADPGIEVSGRAVTPSGRPGSGATVCLAVEPETCDAGVESARTDDQGGFSLRQAMPEHGWLLVLGSGRIRGRSYTIASARIVVRRGASLKGVRIELPDTGRVEVEVLAGGRPIPAAEVRVRSEPVSPGATSGPDGRVVLD